MEKSRQLLRHQLQSQKEALEIAIDALRRVAPTSTAEATATADEISRGSARKVVPNKNDSDEDQDFVEAVAAEEEAVSRSGEDAENSALRQQVYSLQQQAFSAATGYLSAEDAERCALREQSSALQQQVAQKNCSAKAAFFDKISQQEVRGGTQTAERARERACGRACARERMR